MDLRERLANRGGYHDMQQRALNIADIAINEITLSLKDISNESR